MKINQITVRFQDTLRRLVMQSLLIAFFIVGFTQICLAESESSVEDGSIDKPYLIENVDDLEQLAINVNNGKQYKDTYFKLVNDIDLEGFVAKGETAEDNNPEKNKGWKPIEQDKSFQGIFVGTSVYDKECDGTNVAIIKNAGVLEVLIEGARVNFIVGNATFNGTNAGEDMIVTFDGFSLSGEDAQYDELSGQPKSVRASILQSESPNTSDYNHHIVLAMLLAALAFIGAVITKTKRKDA